MIVRDYVLRIQNLCPMIFKLDWRWEGSSSAAVNGGSLAEWSREAAQHLTLGALQKFPFLFARHWIIQASTGPSRVQTLLSCSNIWELCSSQLCSSQPPGHSFSSDLQAKRLQIAKLCQEQVKEPVCSKSVRYVRQVPHKGCALYLQLDKHTAVK